MKYAFRVRTYEAAAGLVDAALKREIVLTLAKECEKLRAKPGESLTFMIDHTPLRAVVTLSDMTIHLMTEQEFVASGLPDAPGRGPSAS